MSNRQRRWPVFASKAEIAPRVWKSPPDTLTMTSPLTYCGAIVIEKSCRQSATVAFQATAPVLAFSATSSSSSRPRKTLPSPYATPRLSWPQQAVILSSGGMSALGW